MTNPDNSKEFRIADRLDPAAGRPLRRRHRPVGYSRYVTFMKFLLPATALALTATIMIWPQVQVIDKHSSIGLSAAKLSDQKSVSMVNARFVGTDQKKQPFSITADIARNLLFGGTQIELEMPKADITVDNGSWLVLTAKTGVYDQKNKTLKLEGAVNLFHDSGYEFKTKTAGIDLKKGIALSKVTVEGQGPFGHLQAEGFRIEERGNRIFFLGKCKLILFPSALKEEK